jgi:hypothetical protein
MTQFTDWNDVGTKLTKNNLLLYVFHKWNGTARSALGFGFTEALLFYGKSFLSNHHTIVIATTALRHSYATAGFFLLGTISSSLVLVSAQPAPRRGR